MQSRDSYYGEITFCSIPQHSSCLLSSWVTFLEFAKVTPTPILYQDVTDLFFREMIHSHFVGPICDTTPTKLTVVTQHKGNALRYAGGYMYADTYIKR